MENFYDLSHAHGHWFSLVNRVMINDIPVNKNEESM